MLYIAMFLVPTLAWIAFQKLWFHHKFTWGEIGVQAFASALVLAGLFMAGNASQVYDEKFVSGAVTELNPQREECPSGWRDWRDDFCTEYRTRQVRDGQTCTTDSKGKQTCVTKYKTQYNYIYDWEQRYFVASDIPSDYEIARVDRQGATTPPRFSEIEIGDPATALVSYTNYIKAASDSLFSKDAFEDLIVEYPEVYDYYRANRLLVDGAVTVDEPAWNDMLMELNTRVRATGANVILVFTDRNSTYSEMLAWAWEAHNINDVVVTVGVADGVVAWADTRSWSKESLVNVAIRDAIIAQKELDIAAFDAIFTTAVTDHFKLKSMDEFEYLKDDISPPGWAMVLAFIFLLIVTPVASWLFYKHDVL